MTNPAEELVVIVDRTNREIGTVTRREMRTKRLLHRSTFILVFNPAGALYVQKRTMNKDIFPGYWDPTTGGVLLAGETYEESAERELAEELGIRDAELIPRYDFLFEDEASSTWGRVFSCCWDGPISPQPEEVEFVELMLPEEIISRSASEKFTPDGLLVVRRLVESR